MDFLKETYLKDVKNFITEGKTVFSEHGFSFIRNGFYRKRGQTMQVFHYSRPGIVELLVVPFWCDVSRGNWKLSEIITKKTKACYWTNLFCIPIQPTGLINDYCEDIDRSEKVITHIKQFVIPEIDSIVDEHSYIEYAFRKKRPLMLDPNAILYDIYNNPAFNFLDICHVIWSMNYRIGTWTLNCLYSKQEPKILKLSNPDSIDFKESFVLNYASDKRYFFKLVYDAIKKGEISNINDVKKREGERMSYIYKENLSLLFEE